MGAGPVPRRADGRRARALCLATMVLVGVGAGAHAAVPGLEDPALAKTVIGCQLALAAAGRTTAAVTLGALGRCAARVVACDQKGGLRDACLEKAAPKCAKHLAKGEKARARGGRSSVG